MAKSKGKLDLDSILGKIKEIVPFASEIKDSKVASITEWIHTGNYILNAIISGSLLGGIPNNKSITFAGVSGCGKTFMCLNLAREAQKMGYKPIYLDTEGAIDLASVEKFGIDSRNFLHVPVSDIVKLKQVVTNITQPLIEAKSKGEETPKLIIFLDSVGMLASSKELNDAVEGADKRDMTKAQMMRSFFRLVTSDLTGLGIPLIMTNHIVTDIGAMFPTFTMSGGLGALYATSVLISMTKGKLKDEKSDATAQTGVVTNVKSEKNRFARPKSAKIHIHFTKGFNAYIGLQDYISWENCGIEKGNILSVQEYNKLKPLEQEKAKPFYVDQELKYFVGKETARNYVVRHLGTTVDLPNLFTGRVFTLEVLKELDEKVIKPNFAFQGGDEDLTMFDDFDGTGDNENTSEIVE